MINCYQGQIMSERIIRMRMQDEVYKKYKKFCIDKDLSISKQTENLILNFVDNVEKSDEHLKECLKYSKEIKK